MDKRKQMQIELGNDLQAAKAASGGDPALMAKHLNEQGYFIKRSCGHFLSKRGASKKCSDVLPQHAEQMLRKMATTGRIAAVGTNVAHKDSWI